MYALETLRDLNGDDLAEYLESKPLKEVVNPDDAFKAPDYSQVDLDQLEKLSGKQTIETLFVDSSGFGEEGESALTVKQFKSRVKELLDIHKELYACLSGVGQFQVYITFLK